MNLRKFTFILSLLLAAGLSAFSQKDSVSVKTIVEKTVKFNNAYPLEKVYLHFDKPYYAVGDTIWFKAYLTTDIPVNADVSKNMHLPSPLSKVIYVDVINSRDSVVQRLKLPVTDGVAYGDVLLFNTKYREGNYHIQAYTRWMRNFDAAYFFNKTIPVGTIIDKNVFNSISLSGGIKNNVAKIDASIHYFTADGRPYIDKKVSWKVQDADDETITKGKGTTDSKGNVNITFTTNKTNNLGAANLVAGIDVNTQTVINSFSLKNAIVPADVQFFPEGGDLINGIKSKVAFKAIKPDGLGADVKGSITDNSGTVVATLTSQHLGMGVFDLTPVAGKTYKANVTLPDGSPYTYDLPQAKDNGMTLSVNNADPNRVTFTFSASDAFFAANRNKQIAILGKSGQIVCYAAQSPLTSKVYSASVPKSKFPSGITQFTIFAANGDALAERIFFIQRNDQLKIDLITAKPSYAVRDKVVFNVTAKTAANQPALANLSVTVLDDQKVPFDENSETTILTTLLLTADLKGYIEKPNYYFNNVNDKTMADLDVLMLTQGYRRFVYKDILADKLPAIKFAPEDGLEIAGSLRTSTGMPVPKGTVNFYVKDMRISATTTTNTEGEFKFSKLFFPDSAKAVVNAKGSYNANNMMIMLNSEVSQAPAPNINAPNEVVNIDTAFNAYLANNKKKALNIHVIKEVVIKEAPIKKASHDDSPVFMGLSSIPDHVIDGKRLGGCPTLYDCMRISLPGIIFVDDKLYLSREYGQGHRTEVALYLNTNLVDLFSLRSIAPETVEQIEVFENDGVSSLNKMSGTQGIVVISTKKAVKTTLDKELLNELFTPQYSAQKISPKGFYMARTFYSPKYDASKVGAFGGDLRSTIYWNPKLLTGKDGTATFDFFNGDGNGTYRAIIEGMDSEGNIGRTVYRYKIHL